MNVQAIARFVDPGGPVVAQKVNLVASVGEGAAQLGGDDAAASERRKAGDGDAQRSVHVLVVTRNGG
jgi:hypothetical protein